MKAPVIAFVAVVLLSAGTGDALAQRGPAARPRDENVLYMQGQRALNASRWAAALDSFTRLASLNGSRRESALYWMAYTQNRLGQRDTALRTLAELLKSYPDSLYAQQARALEVEVRRDAGEPMAPETQSDQELKIIALQGLLRSDPQRAVTLLDEMLRSTAPPRMKTRAFFVIAQSDSPLAQQIVADVARGAKSPELQEPALNYLAARRTAESRRLLSDIYTTSADVSIKRRVIRAFVRSDDAEPLVALARQEANAPRKRELVQALSQMRNNKAALDFLEELLR